MGFRDWLDPENISEQAWKLRCKISSPDKYPKRIDEPKLPRSFTGFEDQPPVDDLEDKTEATIEGEDEHPDRSKFRIGYSKSKKPALPSHVADGKEAAFGQDLTIRTFYEGKRSRDTHYDWVNHPPKQLSKSAARANDRTAIKVYKVKDRDRPSMGGRFPLRYHKIEVQNPDIISRIAPILKQKEDVNLDVNEIASFEYPFRELWFSKDAIAAAHQKAKQDGDEEGIKLELLLHVMKAAFEDLTVKWRHVKTSGLVDFKAAWTLFPRGSTVYSYGMNSETVCKVEGTTLLRKPGMSILIIDAKSLSFNGEEFVWEEVSLKIPDFSGNKPIAELPHYPLEYHPSGGEILKRLVVRGKRALDLQGLQYCCYDGIALHQPDEKTIEKHNVESRVLIDVVGYNKYHLSKGSRELKDPTTARNLAVQRLNQRYQYGLETHPHLTDEEIIVLNGNDGVGNQAAPQEAEGAESKTKSQRLSKEKQERNKREMLEKPEDLAFMSPTIGGYALKNKLWVQFYTEDIRPMAWNDEAYDHLVYDAQQKDLVLSFVEHHKRTTDPNNKTPGGEGDGNVEDVILGKGQGLILLLSGPPGTGKTLTAEAVADRAHRPLFYLQAEDLGINASALGANLKRVFEMATDWDAVILLDEADVFMAERNPNDIHRNELVSIFLRELEYFRGIIFLTTNLYHTIDAAFRSRVSLHLLFRALDANARAAVWKKFLDRVPERKQLEAGGAGTKGVKVSEEGGNEEEAEEEEVNANQSGERPLDGEDIKELALWSLNGREIKNAVKMVRSWCQQKKYVMTLERLESGIRVTSPHASKEGDAGDDLYNE